MFKICKISSLQIDITNLKNDEAIVIDKGYSFLLDDAKEWAFKNSKKLIVKKTVDGRTVITAKDMSLNLRDALIVSIMKAIRNKPDQTKSWISCRSNISKYSKDFIFKTIDSLVESGSLVSYEDIDKRNGGKLTRYKLAQ